MVFWMIVLFNEIDIALYDSQYPHSFQHHEKVLLQRAAHAGKIKI